MARGRPMLCAEDAKALTLLMSPAADEFTIALDRCGWMIVPQPQFGDRRWFITIHPTPVRGGLTKMWLKSRRPPCRACESSTAAKIRLRWTEPQSQDHVG
jgi:hypothetical protein